MDKQTLKKNYNPHKLTMDNNIYRFKNLPGKDKPSHNCSHETEVTEITGSPNNKKEAIQVSLSTSKGDINQTLLLG